MTFVKNGWRFADHDLESVNLTQASSSQTLGALLEGCRQYLLLVANQEFDRGLTAKAGASDLVQDTLLIAQQKRNEFRGTTSAELKAWLRQILLNHLATVRRRYLEAQKRTARREVSLDGLFPSAAEALAGDMGDMSSPSSQFIRSELAEAVEAAVNRLPERQRLVIHLRHWQQLPFDEVARRLELSSVAARQLWARAIKRLRRELRGVG